MVTMEPLYSCVLFSYGKHSDLTIPTVFAKLDSSFRSLLPSHEAASNRRSFTSCERIGDVVGVSR
jgi:hypothetical protein